jgi:hypothetical protein
VIQSNRPATKSVADSSNPGNADSGTAEDDGSGTKGRGGGLSAGAATLFLLLRLMAISHWNWHTAFAVADVVDFSDTIAIVFGTLFAQPVYTSILLMWLLPLTVIQLVWPIRNQRRHVLSNLMLLAAFAACTVALVATFNDWWLLVGATLVAVAFVAVRLVWRRGSARKGVVLALRSARIMAAVAALLLAAVVTTPWTPLEHIRTKSGAMDGYVMKVESGYLRVLTNHGRELKIVPRDEVISRS